MLLLNFIFFIAKGRISSTCSTLILGGGKNLDVTKVTYFTMYVIIQ